MRTSLAICSAILLIGCTGEMPVDESESAVQGELRPNGKGYVTREVHAAKPGGGSNNGIVYHGGPVMLNTVNIYYIWYGNWSGNSATTILTNFISNLGGSSYEAINSTYYNGSNQHVTGQLNYAGSVTDSSYKYGSSLSDAQIQSIVADHCGALGNCDTNAVYFVLTAGGVTGPRGLFAQYWGWVPKGTNALHAR